MFMSDAFRAEWSPRLLSVLRIVAALCFLQHGMTKLLGFPGHASAHLSMFPELPAGVIELVGSLFLLVGFYSRLAAFIMSGEMAFAYFFAHQPRGLFPYNNGGTLAIMYCFVFLYLAIAGGGPWSLDHRRAAA
jgi:putative oxidoreductase